MRQKYPEDKFLIKIGLPIFLAILLILTNVGFVLWLGYWAGIIISITDILFLYFIFRFLPAIRVKRIYNLFKRNMDIVSLEVGEVQGFRYFLDDIHTPWGVSTQRRKVLIKTDKGTYQLISRKKYKIGDSEKIYIIKNSKYKYAILKYELDQIKKNSK